MTVLPPQVQAAGDRSDAILAQMMSPTPQPEAVSATPPASATTDTPDPSTLTPATSKEIPREQTVEYWRQRYHVVSGKYNAEVPGLHQQIRDRDARISELESKLAAQPATSSTASPDLSSFDPELVDMTRKVAHQVAAEAVRAFESRSPTPSPAPASAPAATSHEDAAKDRFIDQLSDLVEDFMEVDQEPGWRTYLAQIEPDTGQPRQARLNVAVKAYDVVTTASIFNSYKRARSARQVPSLESRLDPGRASNGSVVPAGEPKRILTRAEVSAFYTDCTRGVFRGKPEEMARRSKEIDEAMREGRIQP